MNPDLLDKLRAMDEAELYAAMYRDPLTGALNRRAFETVEAAHPFVAIVDLDSLKWLNDQRGHRAGDEALKTLALWLVWVFGSDRVFRIAGDEFVVVGERRNDLTNLLKKLRTDIHKRFSFGVGATLVAADAKLRKDKTDRTTSGDRAERGEKPFWA